MDNKHKHASNGQVGTKPTLGNTTNEPNDKTNISVSLSLDAILLRWQASVQATEKAMHHHQQVVENVKRDIINTVSDTLLDTPLTYRCDRNWINVLKSVDSIIIRCCVIEITNQEINLMTSTSKTSYRSSSYNHQSEEQMKNMYHCLYNIIRKTNSTTVTGPVGF
jgi:hypothetical protein